MFGGLKNLASMASLMSQAGDIQGKIAEAAKTRGRILTVAMEALDRVSRVATGDQLIELAGGARE